MTFQEQQTKIEFFNSKEFKEHEKQEREKSEKDFRKDYYDLVDEMPDGSDDQEYDLEREENA